MLRGGIALSSVAAAAVLVAACGASGGGSTASSGGSGTTGSGGSTGNGAAAKGAISTRQLSGIGTALVNSSGMTLYTPKTPAESQGMLKCTGSCLTFWFPATASSATPSSGGLPGQVSTIHRPDGKTQLTYNGKPLYTFRLDTAAGQAHGNNFTDHFGGTTFTWEVVVSHGSAGGAASPASSPSYGAGY